MKSSACPALSTNMDCASPYSTRPDSTYKSGKVVQTSGATSKFVNYAWMSQASYLGLEEVQLGSTNLLNQELLGDNFAPAKRFAERQATTFTNANTGYSFISHIPNTFNGTSLTVFKSNNLSDGSYTIAVRGTEPGAQFATDLLQDLFGVVLAGKAKVQLLGTEQRGSGLAM